MISTHPLNFLFDLQILYERRRQTTDVRERARGLEGFGPSATMSWALCNVLILMGVYGLSGMI